MFLVATVLLIFSQRVPADENEKPKPVEAGSPVVLHAALSHGVYTKSAPPRLFLKIDYVAAASAAPNRPPLNIALVLDHSGSMAEKRKLPFTIEAAREVIQNMTDRDVLSLIAFNNKVTVLSPAGRVVNKTFLLHRLEEVAPGGYTDISAGLLEGIAQIDSQRAEGQVQQVLLLTDGMANRGVTNLDGLRQIAEKAHARGIGLSTFGSGTEFNEKRLSEMATAGGGRYTYVEDPEKIPEAFVNELHGLLQAVAQNSVLETTVTGGRITKIGAEPLEGESTSQKIEIGNLRAGERGGVLMEIQPTSFEPGAALRAQVRLTFDSPAEGTRMQQQVEAQASVAANAETTQLEENGAVMLYANVLSAVQQAEEAAKGLDREMSRRAHAAFDQLYERAHQQAVATNDQELLNETFLFKHFMDELSEAEQENLLHNHKEAHAKLAKEAHYQEYLLKHHSALPSHQ